MVATLNTSSLSLPLSYTFHMLCLMSSLLLAFLTCLLTSSCTLSLPYSIRYTLPYTLFPTLSSGSLSSAHSLPSILYALRLFITPSSFCSLAHPHTHTHPLLASLTLSLTLTHSLTVSISHSLSHSFALFYTQFYCRLVFYHRMSDNQPSIWSYPNLLRNINILADEIGILPSATSPTVRPSRPVLQMRISHSGCYMRCVLVLW